MSRFGAGLLLGLVGFLFGCAVPERQVVSGDENSGPNEYRLISVPTGDYWVGAVNHVVNPRRRVHLKGFRIADAETTNEQFARFVRATGYVSDAEKHGYGLVSKEGMIDWAWNQTPGASWRQPMGPDGPKAEDLPNHPVTQISGADAEAYCKWAGGRLPTLDEWEVAARAGSDTRWPWGDIFDPKLANVWNGENHLHNTREDGWVYTSPVRSYPPNAWGLYDVIGNVFEYCADLPQPHRASERARLVSGRGGSWWCSTNCCNFFNLDDIGTMDLHGTLANQGFRIVFDVRKAR